jgi:hypothetical protein
MEQNMCQFQSSPKETEYSNEDKKYFLFLNSYHFTFVFALQIC